MEIATMISDSVAIVLVVSILTNLSLSICLRIGVVERDGDRNG